ncbi:MAG: Clp1/GlmU family protein [Candidatus Methanomethylicia archaeon]
MSMRIEGNSNIVNISSGKFLKVEGPAYLEVLQGKITVLGKEVQIKEPIIIPRSKVLVFNVISSSIVKIKCGVGGYFEEIEEVLIPMEWRNIVTKVLEFKKPLVIMILGTVESGKTTLCTFVANESFSKNYKTAVVDSDVGQSDLGPPATIGVGFLEREITFLSEIPLFDIFFAGSTSPKEVYERILLSTRKAVDRALENGAEVIVVNTDGWISDMDAKKFKTSLILSIEPNVILCIQRYGELESILKAFKNFSSINIFRLPPAKITKTKSKEERKLLREHAFARLFSDAKVISLNINRLSFLYSVFGSGLQITNNSLREYESTLNIPIVYGESSTDFVFLVCKGSLNEEKIKNMKNILSSKNDKITPIIVDENFAKNILVGLFDSNHKFLGLGIIMDIDFYKRTIDIFTNVKESNVCTVAFGNIKLSEDGREIGKIDPWSFQDPTASNVLSSKRN